MQDEVFIKSSAELFKSDCCVEDQHRLKRFWSSTFGSCNSEIPRRLSVRHYLDFYYDLTCRVSPVTPFNNDLNTVRTENWLFLCHCPITFAKLSALRKLKRFVKNKLIFLPFLASCTPSPTLHFPLFSVVHITCCFLSRLHSKLGKHLPFVLTLQTCSSELTSCCWDGSKYEIPASL